MKKGLRILLIINIFIAFVLSVILPEFISKVWQLGRLLGVGLSIIIIEIPICFIIFEKSSKDKK